jgi:hypothetical protein
MPSDALPRHDAARLADRRPRGGHTAGLAWLWSRLVRAHRPAMARAVTTFDDRLLRDIGLSRGEPEGRDRRIPHDVTF